MMRSLSTLLFLFMSSLLMTQTIQAAPVKQSSSGICHPEDSAFYDRTKNYKLFQTLESCLQQGGRLPKGYNAQPSESVGTGYERSKFGHGWDDADRDCQNSRHEALIAQP